MRRNTFAGDKQRKAAHRKRKHDLLPSIPNVSQSISLSKRLVIQAYELAGREFFTALNTAGDDDDDDA